MPTPSHAPHLSSPSIRNYDVPDRLAGPDSCHGGAYHSRLEADRLMARRHGLDKLLREQEAYKQSLRAKATGINDLIRGSSLEELEHAQARRGLEQHPIQREAQHEQQPRVPQRRQRRKWQGAKAE